MCLSWSFWKILVHGQFNKSQNWVHDINHPTFIMKMLMALIWPFSHQDVTLYDLIIPRGRWRVVTTMWLLQRVDSDWSGGNPLLSCIITHYLDLMSRETHYRVLCAHQQRSVSASITSVCVMCSKCCLVFIDMALLVPSTKLLTTINLAQ